MRRHLPVFITAVVLLGFLAVDIKFMVDAWQHSAAVMSIHGWVALGLGVFFSIVIGCGLMALMFYRSRYGYDEQAQSTEYHRDAPRCPQRANDPQRSTHGAKPTCNLRLLGWKMPILQVDSDFLKGQILRADQLGTVPHLCGERA